MQSFTAAFMIYLKIMNCILLYIKAGVSIYRIPNYATGSRGKQLDILLPHPARANRKQLHSRSNSSVLREEFKDGSRQLMV